MKIVFIITGLSTGGAERMLCNIVQNIPKDRYECYVISLTTKGHVGTEIEKFGVRVYALGIRRMRVFWGFLRLVYRLRKIQPDVVHTWMYHADLLGGIAARLVGIRKVLWGIRASNLSKKGVKKTTLLVVRLCAQLSHWLPKCILSCSERAKTVHIRAGYCATKMVVIPNGFAIDRFKPNTKAKIAVRQQLSLPDHAQVVGLFARYDAQKNHQGFIQAAHNIAPLLPNVHFVCAGKDIDWNNTNIVTTIDEHYQKRFHLLGRRDDIPELMAALDVYVSSSWSEAFPNVVGEAMACGIPCVVTDVGDSASIVGDTGCVVAVDDMHSLAHCVIELLEQPALRMDMGKRARYRVQEKYDIRDITRKYQHLYHTLFI